MMIVRGKAKSVARPSSPVRTGFTNGTSPSTTSWTPPPPAREIRGTTLRLVGFRYRCENRGGKMGLVELESYLLKQGEAAPNVSGRQEFLENLINEFIW
jgi:hypothetical protein